MNIWVLIPAYNEAAALARLLQELAEKKLSVVVVDDGSVDATYQIAIRYATVVLRNDVNRGKGLSLKRGIVYLLERKDFDYLVTMDADGQHAPRDLDAFFSRAAAGENFVVGNRMNNHGSMPGIRVITNKCMSWFLSRLAGQKIPDTQCGFRLISRTILEAIKITTSKFEVESEILVKAARKGYAISSVSIESIYFKGQRSKIRPIVDTLRFLRFIFLLNHET
ncbi:MAG: glycosyltransferase family 2 protein [Candidatus Omnitrophota bacterium]|nr:glycosyltransferase family 2 protein [Candidatus Omnitrophota bacterium]